MSFRLGISLRVAQNETYPERRDCLSHDWPKFFAENFAGDFILVPVLNYGGHVRSVMSSLAIEGLLLSGGNDLDQAPCRDAAERQMFEYCLEYSLPVLGVCRGLQFINQYFGGSLETELADISGTEHAAVEHPVELVDAEFAGQSRSSALVVNSYHDQGVMLKGLAEKLSPFALAQGGVVEGCYCRDLPLAAVQWHPERTGLGESLEFDNSLIRRTFLEK